MQIVKFDDIREIMIESMRKSMLIPILGSGFTRGCGAFCGNVPSGEDYRRYMIDAISSSGDFSSEEISSLSSESFSKISNVYHATVSEEKQREYLRANFTQVSLDICKKKLLSIPWPYVYTLNIDDAIERNSEFQSVIYSNRRVRKSVFDEQKCVIKLHGDITEVLNYEDSVSEIFDQTQYIASLHQNASLLSKLTHDLSYQNIVYIGCSLADEIDLLSVSESLMPNENIRFFCTTKTPSRLEQIDLGRYKITHCVVFESYQEIYSLIYDAAQEAEKIASTEIERYRTYKFESLSEDFTLNKSYLFHGKGLINKDRSVTLPYFFISRNVTDQLIENMQTHNLQLLLGGGCSGKTYIAIDVAARVRDRDVFVFESKETLSDVALQALLERRNCLIIADSNTLNIRQIERLIRNNNDLKKQNITVLIIENKNNRDLAGLIKLLELNGVIEPQSIPQIIIPNKFNENETNELNQRLVTANLGIFSEKKTIADNIIKCSHDLLQKNKFDRIIPHFANERQIACLIALAIENKVYSSRAVDLDLLPEIHEQERATKPLIEIENTQSFEITPSNNSPIKYVVNAEYWLCNQLCEFSKTKVNQALIIQSYRHIIFRLVSIYGKPDLTYGDKYAQYKPYILFDNINQIFMSHGLVLIREIYKSLNDLLSSDPNYMHQRAKCYIRSAYFEADMAQKLTLIEQAYRDASLSYSVFEKRYEDTKNERVQISIAHVEYTKSLALCHKAKLNRYQNISENTQTVEILCRALSSPYNSYDFAKTDIYNYGNVVMEVITTMIANKSLVDTKVYRLLEELFKKINT